MLAVSMDFNVMYFKCVMVFKTMVSVITVWVFFYNCKGDIIVITKGWRKEGVRMETNTHRERERGR